MAVKTRQLQPLEHDAPPANPDADVMIGGPGQEVPPETETPPAAPQQVEVTINGRRFLVDPELAQEYDRRNRDIDRKMNEHAAELGELRKLRQPAPPPVQAKEDDIDTLIFANPREALKREREATKAELRAEYEREKAMDKFWNTFYRLNPDLDPDEDGAFVESVMSRNMRALGVLEVPEAAKQLADLSRRELLRISQKAKLLDADNDNPTQPRTRVESASPPRPRAPAPQDSGPSTLTDVIKARRARFQKSA